MHYALHARLLIVACVPIHLQRINIRQLQVEVCLLQDGQTGNQQRARGGVEGWNRPCRKEVKLAPKP